MRILESLKTLIALFGKHTLRKKGEIGLVNQFSQRTTMFVVHLGMTQFASLFQQLSVGCRKHCPFATSANLCVNVMMIIPQILKRTIRRSVDEQLAPRTVTVAPNY